MIIHDFCFHAWSTTVYVKDEFTQIYCDHDLSQLWAIYYTVYRGHCTEAFIRLKRTWMAACNTIQHIYIENVSWSSCFVCAIEYLFRKISHSISVQHVFRENNDAPGKTQSVHAWNKVFNGRNKLHAAVYTCMNNRFKFCLLCFGANIFLDKRGFKSFNF